LQLFLLNSRTGIPSENARLTRKIGATRFNAPRCAESGLRQIVTSRFRDRMKKGLRPERSFSSTTRHRVCYLGSEIIRVVFIRRLNVMQLAVRDRVSLDRGNVENTYGEYDHATRYLSEKALHLATSCLVQIIVYPRKFKFQISNFISIYICIILCISISVSVSVHISCPLYMYFQ